MPSLSSQSIPHKKRIKTSVKIPLEDSHIIMQNCKDKEDAAAALASLSEKESSDSGCSIPSGNRIESYASDSESSYTSQNGVLPKAIHAPPTSSNMVDHTYKDYSVIAEDTLSFLEADERHSNVSDWNKIMKDKKIMKLTKIFGEIGPSRKNSGGVVKPFPEKLMEVLNRNDMDAIITWLPHGRAFIVLEPVQLKDIVLPRFFKQTKFMSFTRQLNLWGFKRITRGKDSGAYYHELFLRGRPRLAMLMRRQKIKGTGIKLTPNPETEPDFYNISKKRPLPFVDSSKNETKPLPPLCQSNGHKKTEQPMDSLEYDRMVRRLNTRSSQNQYNAEQQVYPFQSQGQVSSIGSFMPQFNQNLNSLNTQQSFLSQQQNSMPLQQYSSVELMAILQQKLLIEQQEKQKNEQNAILSARRLLGEANVGMMNGNSLNRIVNLKQRLLDAASSLDSLNQPQQPVFQNQQYHNMVENCNTNNGYHSFLNGSQQVVQAPQNLSVSAIMKAYENSRSSFAP